MGGLSRHLRGITGYCTFTSTIQITISKESAFIKPTIAIQKSVQHSFVEAHKFKVIDPLPAMPVPTPIPYPTSVV